MVRIVLAYSGGLDTTAAIPWLIETYGVEVVSLTLDLGQRRELMSIRDRALAAGAIRAHVLDVRHEFARDFVLPALHAGAIHEDGHSLASALAWPLIAQKLVEIAALEQADAVAYGDSHEGGRDRTRLDVALRALKPGIRVIVPARDWNMTRTDAVAYARARGIPAPPALEDTYHVDENLWGRSIAGRSGNPPAEPEGIYAITRSPAAAADVPASLEVAFARGVPISVNGVAMPLVDLITSLETIAGAHGVGRLDSAGKRWPETRSHGIYEAPAAVVLNAAYHALERVVVPRDLQRLKRQLSSTYADLIHDGLWYSPTREAIDALVTKIQERVTGAVRLRLWKGQCSVVERSEPVSSDSGSDLEGPVRDHDTTLPTPAAIER